jgi:hypothetical protein
VGARSGPTSWDAPYLPGLIALGPLTVLGNVAVAAVALAVLGSTVLEIVGLRRFRAA